VGIIKTTQLCEEESEGGGSLSSWKGMDGSVGLFDQGSQKMVSHAGIRFWSTGTGKCSVPRVASCMTRGFGHRSTVGGVSLSHRSRC
jgi:hypothetical protein